MSKYSLTFMLNYLEVFVNIVLHLIKVFTNVCGTLFQSSHQYLCVEVISKCSPIFCLWLNQLKYQLRLSIGTLVESGSEGITQFRNWKNLYSIYKFTPKSPTDVCSDAVVISLLERCRPLLARKIISNVFFSSIFSATKEARSVNHNQSR